MLLCKTLAPVTTEQVVPDCTSHGVARQIVLRHMHQLFSTLFLCMACGMLCCGVLSKSVFGYAGMGACRAAFVDHFHSKEALFCILNSHCTPSCQQLSLPRSAAQHLQVITWMSTHASAAEQKLPFFLYPAVLNIFMYWYTGRCIGFSCIGRLVGQSTNLWGLLLSENKLVGAFLQGAPLPTPEGRFLSWRWRMAPLRMIPEPCKKPRPCFSRALLSTTQSSAPLKVIETLRLMFPAVHACCMFASHLLVTAVSSFMIALVIRVMIDIGCAL
jgi:hypothetical protein